MAAGDTLLIFSPLGGEPPAADFAVFDVRNQHPILNYQATSAVSAVFSGIVPRHYGGTAGITVYIHYAAASAAGNVDWQSAFERIGDQQQDIDSDSFATAVTASATTVPGTTGLVDIVAIVHTDGAQIDSIAVGESFRLKITRDAPNDTLTDIAQLVMVELKDT